MAEKKNTKKINWLRKRMRIKNQLNNSNNKPKLVVFRSNIHIYAQVVDVLDNKTIASCSSNDKDLKKEMSKCDSKVAKSSLVGKVLAEKLNKMKIDNIVFDRNGYNYHGRVKALADAMREMKIKF
tara:strand:- start:1380 stop:1754 length:375 start_codon:yes stop_codon:yes gene_type:complete